jgi:hypothetical protein
MGCEQNDFRLAHSVVDCWTGYDDATDTVDGVHPNSSGDAKPANAWFTPLKNAITAASGGAPATTTAGSGGTTASSTTGVISPTTSGATSPVWGQCGKLSVMLMILFALIPST